MHCGGHTRRDGGNQATTIKLAVFDLDGTLTRTGTSVLCHVGHEFGFAATAKRLSALYSEGTLTNATVSRVAAEHLRGRARVELERALVTLPMVEGIAETIALLASLDVSCALATITFDFAAQYVAQNFGFERVSATALEWSPDDRATGHVRDVLEGQDKCRFIARQCDELGISPEEVLVVGDAHSDIPAMKMAGWSVGFNPTKDVEDLASVSLHHSTDLRDVVPHIRHLLGDPA
jgi:HAD superfamily phosphoserine phosphatase-like hydrolase